MLWYPFFFFFFFFFFFCFVWINLVDSSFPFYVGQLTCPFCLGQLTCPFFTVCLDHLGETRFVLVALCCTHALLNKPGKLFGRCGVFFLTPVFRGLFYYYYFIFYTHNAFLTFFYPLDWSTWLGDRHYPFGDTHPFDFGPYTPYHCQCRALQQVTSLALSLFELLWYRHRHW